MLLLTMEVGEAGTKTSGVCEFDWTLTTCGVDAVSGAANWLTLFEEDCEAFLICCCSFGVVSIAGTGSGTTAGTGTCP